MKISMNWIQQYIDFELPSVHEVAQRIGSQLGEVEEIINLGETYQGIIIVKVVECVDHPDSDHMHVCKIDDGGKAQNVERDENGFVQVVCGATNVRAGMMAAWLPPGSTVPESIGKDPFVLGSRNLRGVMSNGMLASPRELAIGDGHEGILDLTDEVVTPSDLPIEPGADFATVYALNDYVINIENKMFTHRPDCFGILGVAREIAGIYGKPFVSPERYRVLDEVETGEGLPFEIQNNIPGSVPRFMAVAIKNVTIKPSPLWLRVELCKVGGKPINNVVDVTNYMMLLTGQPLHAYDYDKVGTGKLTARFAMDGEQIALLNGKTIILNEADMVITDGTRPVGLGGVMGGSETEVSGETTNVILECATFDMYTIRRTSMRHGLFTDGVTRFNKGQSPLQNPYIMQLALGHLSALSGGEQASMVLDNDHTEGRTSVHSPLPVSAEFINIRLGFDLTAEAMAELLRNVEFIIGIEGDVLAVTAPYWRTDIETREDVVEEVGRLYGLDKLPINLPRRSIKPVTKDSTLELKSHIRATLAKAGANEVLTYSFVHGDLLSKAGQDPDRAYRLSNALSPDLQYYRTAMMPSLLDKIHLNQKSGYDSFSLFELGTVHYIGEMDETEPTVPNEDNHLGFILAYSDKQRPEGAAYYHARTYLKQLIDLESVDLVRLTDFDLSTDEWGRQLTASYEPGRSAVLVRDNQIWGVIGEFKSSVRKALKLPTFCAGFEIHLALLGATQNAYRVLSRFPKVTQDITLKVSADLAYADLHQTMTSTLADKTDSNEMLYSVEPLDIYQRSDDPGHKQVTFRLMVANYQRTMTDGEVTVLLDQVTALAHENHGAERV